MLALLFLLDGRIKGGWKGAYSIRGELCLGPEGGGGGGVSSFV